MRKNLRKVLALIMATVTVLSVMCVGMGTASALGVDSYKAYYLRVKTGDIEDAGTDADVFMDVTLVDGSVTSLCLNYASADLDSFEQGTEFKGAVVPIHSDAAIKSIKFYIGENWYSSGESDWYLESFQLYNNVFTLEQEVNQWVTAENSYTCVYDNTELDTSDYKLTVETGSVDNAGTDADVYVILEAESGAIFRTSLSEHCIGTDGFENGDSNEFTFNLSNVFSEIKSVKFWIESDWYEEIAEDWYLNNVKLEQITETGNVVKFENSVKQWLTEETSYSFDNSLIKYDLTLVTGNNSYAGTDATVYAEIHSDYGPFVKINLSEMHPELDSFIRNEEKTIHLTLSSYFSEIDYIKFYMETDLYEIIGDDWYFESFRLEQTNGANKGKVIEQSVKRWINEDAPYTFFVKGDAFLNENYTLYVKTADVLKAGTDADVLIDITFEDGAVHTVNLSDLHPKANAFERNDEAIIGFSLEQNSSKIKSVKFRVPYTFWDFTTREWCLESFRLTKLDGVNAGDGVSRTGINKWVGETSYTFYA